MCLLVNSFNYKNKKFWIQNQKTKVLSDKRKIHQFSKMCRSAYLPAKYLPTKKKTFIVARVRV